MKNQKTSPSLGLYKEGLLQLRFMGLLAGGLIVLVSVAETVLVLITAYSSGQGSLGSLVAYVVDPTALLSFAGAAVWLLPFLFVLRLFSFLNRRNRADFYHALPASRLRMYFSFLAAVLTWIWGIGLIVVALTVATNVIAGTALTFAAVASALGLFLTASLFAVAATLVAVSITGTVFSNLSVTALIILLPHVIATCFSQSVTALVPNIPQGFVGLVGAAAIQNTFFMLSPSAMLVGSSSAPPVSNGASIAVTFMWAVLLIGAGAWLFVRRPSEAAGKSAPSRWLQLVYRVAVGVLVVALGMGGIIGISSIFESGIAGVPVIPSDTPPSLALGARIGSILGLLLAAFIVFLLFELITTRKWGRLVRALPSFALVIAFAFAFYGLISVYSTWEKNFKPQADQISYVRLLSMQYGMGYMGSGGMLMDLVGGEQPTYNDLLLRQTKVTDPQFLQVSAQKLQETVSPDIAYGGADENFSVMLLELHTKSGRTAFRLVNARTGTKPDAFSRALFSTPEVAGALLALPKLDQRTQVVSYNYLNFSDGPSISPISKTEREQKARELYQVFKAEYELLSPADQYQLLYGMMYRGEPFIPSGETTSVALLSGAANLDVTGVLGTKAFTNSYSLTTAKAAEMSWDMTRSELAKGLDTKKTGFYPDELDLYDSQSLLALSSMVETSTPSDPLWSVMTKRAVQIYGNNETGAYKSSVIGEREREKAVAIIRPALSRGFVVDAPYYLQINYGVYNNRDQQLGSNWITIPLTEQEAAALQALTK
ncbi:MAG: hypothetical protein FWC54_04380 [Actinomycetia bacterium]|nr:hypothetical protein [Actinomycetes bacterium]